MDEVVKKQNLQPPLKTDPYTEELFQKIKEQNITIDPTIWSMLTHVLGNRMLAIMYNLGDFLDTPKWILKTGSYVMIFLYKITGGRGKMYTVDVQLKRALNNAVMIKDFLNRLRKETEKKAGF
ncbi:MAG: hypothetical protein NTU54_03520 [Candidatus Omnitrophica bacterium]|nr:hypothetical protein [Candidatus Omnitrophota bacterium]